MARRLRKAVDHLPIAGRTGLAMKPSIAQGIVVLGMGGTIAGESANVTDNVSYTSASRPIHALIGGVPGLAGRVIEAEQVAQVDSKDMTHELWARLARRVAFHLDRPEVAGVVITHGTDTLEETAWLLHRVLAPWSSKKPIVLTAAMRPATSLQADGPQNLLDAVSLASIPGASGVLLVMGGQVWAGAEVRKVHSWRLGAFDAGDAGPLGSIREGRWIGLRPWPIASTDGAPRPDDLPASEEDWPWVEIVCSHAGVSAAGVRVLLRSVSPRLRGLVVASTGNGSVHHALLESLEQAQRAGVAVLRATRCSAGGIMESTQAQAPELLPSAGSLTPAQARVELVLQCLAGWHRRGRGGSVTSRSA